jgi:hypothetical protein
MKTALSGGWQRRWWTFPPQRTEFVRLPQSIDQARPPRQANIHHFASDSTPLTSKFLIGTPRLEFPATSTKQSPDVISNRDRSGGFSSKSSTRVRSDRSIGIPIHKQDRAQRATACAASPAQAFALEGTRPLARGNCPERATTCAAPPAQPLRSEATCRLQESMRAQRATACAVLPAQTADSLPFPDLTAEGEPLRIVTNHSSLVTDFLIGTPRLEFSATSTKQSPAVISNRDRSGVFSSKFSTRERPVDPRNVVTFFLTNHKSPVTNHDFSSTRVLGRPCILPGDTHQCICLRLETLGLASQAL